MSRWVPVDELLDAYDPGEQGIWLTVDLPKTREDRRRLRSSEKGSSRRKQPRHQGARSFGGSDGR